MIAKIGVMRNLTTTHRLQALSVPEIKEPFDELVFRCARRYKFQGRKLQPGAVLNAIVLAFLKLDEAERQQRIVAGLAELEAILSTEADGSGVIPGSGEASQAVNAMPKKLRKKGAG